MALAEAEMGAAAMAEAETAAARVEAAALVEAVSGAVMRVA